MCAYRDDRSLSSGSLSISSRELRLSCLDHQVASADVSMCDDGERELDAAMDLFIEFRSWRDFSS